MKITNEELQNLIVQSSKRSTLSKDELFENLKEFSDNEKTISLEQQIMSLFLISRQYTTNLVYDVVKSILIELDLFDTSDIDSMKSDIETD